MGKARKVRFEPDLDNVPVVTSFEELQGMVGKHEFPHWEMSKDAMCDEHVDEQSAEKKYKAGYTQWMVDGKDFVPITESVSTLPAGFYTFKYNNSYQKNLPTKIDIISEDLLELPDNNFDKIISDIQKFWKSEAKFKKYNYVYKRGILMYGSQGCGKTSLILMLANDLVKNHDGIVFNIRHSDDIFAFDEIMIALREIEPKRRVITIIEDIDNFFTREQDYQTKLLNILSGNMQYDNIVIIATTNFPEKLQERILNRPSRFDIRCEIGLPTVAVRRYYIEKKLGRKAVKTIDIERWIKDTHGMTLDHLRELILAVFVLDYTYDNAIEYVKNMNDEKPKSSMSRGNKVAGFNSKANEEE